VVWYGVGRGRWQRKRVEGKGGGARGGEEREEKEDGGREDWEGEAGDKGGTVRLIREKGGWYGKLRGREEGGRIGSGSVGREGDGGEGRGEGGEREG